MTGLRDIAPELFEPLARAAVRRALEGRSAPARLPADLPFGDDGLALDSLERWRFGAALIERLHLDETGGEDRLYLAGSIAEAAAIAAALFALCEPQRLSFRTSGTTGGDGRVVTHDAAFLAREAAAVADVLRIDRAKNRSRASPPRIGLAASPLHLFGFQNGVVAAAHSSGRLIDLSDSGPPRRADLEGLDVFVATPAHLDHLAAIARGRRFDTPFRVISSSFALSDALADRLAAMGLIDVLDLYGATETAAIGARWVGDGAGFVLLDHLARTDDGGVADAATGVALTPPDALNWIDARRFTLGARADLVVKIAGRRVDLAPAAVALAPIIADRDWLFAVSADDATTRCGLWIAGAENDALRTRAVRALDDALSGAAGAFDVRFTQFQAFQSGKPGRILRLATLALSE